MLNQLDREKIPDNKQKPIAFLNKIYYNNSRKRADGGEGLGNFGHGGRPGEIGGSAPAEETSQESNQSETRETAKEENEASKEKIKEEKTKQKIQT